MIEKHIHRADLVGKTIDIHSHAGHPDPGGRPDQLPLLLQRRGPGLSAEGERRGRGGRLPHRAGSVLRPADSSSRQAGTRPQPARSRRRPTSARTASCSPTSTSFCPGAQRAASCRSSRWTRAGWSAEQIAILARAGGRSSRSTASRSAPVIDANEGDGAAATRGRRSSSSSPRRDWPILFHVAVEPGRGVSPRRPTPSTSSSATPSCATAWRTASASTVSSLERADSAAQRLGGHLRAQDPGRAGRTRTAH